MPSLHIDDIRSETYAELERRARAEGRSVEHYVRDLLDTVVGAPARRPPTPWMGDRETPWSPGSGMAVRDPSAPVEPEIRPTRRGGMPGTPELLSR